MYALQPVFMIGFFLDIFSDIIFKISSLKYYLQEIPSGCALNSTLDISLKI